MPGDDSYIREIGRHEATKATLGLRIAALERELAEAQECAKQDRAALKIKRDLAEAQAKIDERNLTLLGEVNKKLDAEHSLRDEREARKRAEGERDEYRRMHATNLEVISNAARDLASMMALLEAAKSVCLTFDWDMTYRAAPAFTPGSDDFVRSALVRAVTKADGGGGDLIASELGKEREARKRAEEKALAASQAAHLRTVELGEAMWRGIRQATSAYTGEEKWEDIREPSDAAEAWRATNPEKGGGT